MKCSVPVSWMLANNKKLSPSGEKTGCGVISSHSFSGAFSEWVCERNEREEKQKCCQIETRAASKNVMKKKKQSYLQRERHRNSNIFHYFICLYVCCWRQSGRKMNNIASQRIRRGKNADAEVEPTRSIEAEQNKNDDKMPQ